jgi:hypothetical protein
MAFRGLVEQSARFIRADAGLLASFAGRQQANPLGNRLQECSE